MYTNGDLGRDWRLLASSRFSVPTALTSKSSNGPLGGEVVAGLRGGVDDGVRPSSCDQRQDGGAVADVQFVMHEARSAR